VGCPNHFNASTTRNNVLLPWRKGNHPSICAKLSQVLTAMNKEERNNYILLEYAVQLITMLGCHLYDIKTSSMHHDPHPIFSLNATTARDKRGSPKDAPPAPPVMHLLGYKPPSSSTKAQAIALAASTLSLTSLPTASHIFHPNLLFLTNSLSSLCRPPACMAVGVTTQTPPSSCKLWTSSCRMTAWILSW